MKTVASVINEFKPDKSISGLKDFCATSANWPQGVWRTNFKYHHSKGKTAISHFVSHVRHRHGRCEDRFVSIPWLC